jgi:hypothetical protein
VSVVVAGGAIRSAIAHLQITRCPRCQRGDLAIDLDRVRMTCTRGCAAVAGAVAEAARRLTGGLRAEGEALIRFAAEASNERFAPEPGPRRSAVRDAIYVAACGLPPSRERERIIALVVGVERRANWQQELANREAAEAAKAAA